MNRQPEADWQTLIIEESADRVLVRLNRPEVRNAIDQQMVDELHRVCASLEASPKILILTGTQQERGGFFASGADIAQLRERRRADALAGINIKLFIRIAQLPMPVIAALDGYVLGGGAELAFAADFRLGTPSIKIGNPETSLGILAAAGASWRLRELVGEPLAKEVLLAGRVLDAQESLAAGLVSALHPPEELIAAANALAERIAAQDQLAVQYTKSVFHAPAGAHPEADMEAQAVLFEAPAKFERMTAFLERKKK